MFLPRFSRIQQATQMHQNTQILTLEILMFKFQARETIDVLPCDQREYDNRITPTCH